MTVKLGQQPAAVVSEVAQVACGAARKVCPNGRC